MMFLTGNADNGSFAVAEATVQSRCGMSENTYKMASYFSSDYEFRIGHQVEYQQCKNYLDWVFNEKSITERLGFAKQPKIGIIDYYENPSETELIKISASTENQIEYIGKTELVDENSKYPFNLFLLYNGNTAYYFKYQKASIMDEIDKILEKLTNDERAIVKFVFEEDKSLEDLYYALGISNNKFLEDAFYEYYYKKLLNKLRHYKVEGEG